MDRRETDIYKIFCIVVFLLLIFVTLNTMYIPVNKLFESNNAQVLSELQILPPAEISTEPAITPDESFGPMSRAPEDVKYWATFQFDYHNTGNTSSKGPNTNNTLWKFKTKGAIYSSPSVVGDSVYFTTTDRYLYSVDIENGTENWKYNLLQNSFSTPTVFNGYVYVGSGTDTQNSENRLFCINGKTGQRLWSEPVNGPIIGAPIVRDRSGTTNDRIYFGTIMNNKIYSFDYVSHELDWEYEVPNGGKSSSDGIWNSMAYYNIANGWLLFAVNSEMSDPNVNRGLFCLDLMNKDSPNWQFVPDEGGSHVRTYSGPTIFQDKVLIGFGMRGNKDYGKMFCLNINDGSEIWNFTTGDGINGYGVTTSAAVAYNRIYFGSCDGKLYTLDFNGKQLWNFTTGDKDDGIYSSPAVADGKLYFGSSDNVFYCLDAYTGDLIWRYKLDDPKGDYGVVSAPAIAYSKVFVGGNNGYLYCFGDKSIVQPPTISINNPKEKEMLNGIIEISGVADDDSEVTKVQVKIDDGGWNNANGKYTWTYSWDTTHIKDGPHKIFARAYDKSGFSMTNVTIVVNNGESKFLLTITSHIDGQLVSGITKFAGTAYGPIGIIEEVQININNATLWERMEGTNDWEFHWDSRYYIDGDYLIQFRAFDGMNYSRPLELWIKVFNYKDPDLEITPMFRGDRNRMGIYNSSVPNATKIVWTNFTENQIYSSGVYYNGRIYYGSDDRLVYCVDEDPSDGIDEGIPDDIEATCDVIWTYETANSVHSTPVIANNRLFIGSTDYYLYCIDAQTGIRIWRTRTGREIDSSPLVLNDTVFVGSYDGKLYCINVSDGKKLRSFETGHEIWGSPAYSESEDCIYIGSRDGKLYCIWAENCSERWNYSSNLASIQYGVYSTPVISNNMVIFGSEDNFVYCINATNGKLIWKFKTNGFVYSSVAIYKGKVFVSNSEGNVGTEFREGYFYAIPLEDPNSDGVITSSEVIWKYKTHDFDGGSSPAVSTVSGKVVVGSNAGKPGGIGILYCFEEETGEMYWNYTINGDIITSPLIANERIYFGSTHGEFYCLGAKGTNGGIIDKNKTQIVVEIHFPITEVLAGHSIENITVTALTENGTPVKGAWFEFDVTKGTLSDNGGTVFDDGTYPLRYYVAPNIKKEKVITFTATASSKGPFLNGSKSITIVVKPSVNDSDEQKDKKDENILEEMVKPKYLYFWIILVVLVILTLLIFTLLLRTKRKLHKLEQGIEEKPKENVKEKDEPEVRVPPPMAKPIHKDSTKK